MGNLKTAILSKLCNNVQPLTENRFFMKTTPPKRTHRFYLPNAEKTGQTLEFNEEILHYASRVLRLNNLNEVHAWNGRGQIFPAVLHYLSKNQAQVVITAEALTSTNTELTRPIYVAQALPEGDKMELILGKCTELGARGFFPFQARRSVVQLTTERAQKKQAHWHKLLISSALQSERLYLPTLRPLSSLNELFNHLHNTFQNVEIILFTPHNTQAHFHRWLAQQNQQVANTNTPIVILVGPEGGFDDTEIELATHHNAHILCFSQRILRTETFALACIAQLTLGLGLEGG